ncbi:MAG: SsrA-binding protein SmpB [Pseudomonadota bacterium]
MTRERDRIVPIHRNRKALHDFEIESRVEAGVALFGSEVKSLRQGRGNLADAYVLFRDGEAWLVNSHIAIYPQANRENHDPTRERKLLLTSRELRKLAARVREKGFALIPLSMYFKGPWVKIELGLGRGRRQHDKREALRERQDRRELERADRDR